MPQFDIYNMTIEEMENQICLLKGEIERRKNIEVLRSWDSITDAFDDFFEKHGFINLEVIKYECIETYELNRQMGFNAKTKTITIFE